MTKFEGAVGGTRLIRVLHKLWNGIARFVRGGLLVAFDVAVLYRNGRGAVRNEGAIFCLHGLGDLLLAGNAIKQLSTMMRARGLRAVLFVEPSLQRFAQEHMDVDAVEGIDRHRFSKPSGYRTLILKQLANRFEIAVQPTYNRMLRVEDFLVRATGAKERIGCAGHFPFIKRSERWLGDRFYTRLVPQDTQPMHELARYAEFMKALEIRLGPDPWTLRVTGPTTLCLPDAYAVVCPDASTAKRMWPFARFMHMAQILSQQYSVAIVLIGTKADEHEVQWSAEGSLPLVDLRGKTMINEMPAILAGAKLILSNDSGPYHMGVALRVPTVAVGGSGIPDRYFPYVNEASLRTKAIFTPVPCAGCSWRCKYHIPRNTGAPCIESVEWPMVASAIDALWNDSPKVSRGLSLANCAGHRHL